MRRLFAVLLTLSIVSCNTNKDTYSIDGTAEGFDNNTPVIVFTIENNQPKALDTLLVQDGKFSGMLPKTEGANINYFNIAKYNGNVIFFPENEDLKVTLYKDSIQSSFVVGGNQNKAYRDFSQKIRGFNSQKQNNIARFKTAREQQDNLLVSQIQAENKAILAEEAAYKKQFVTENTNSIFSVMLLSEMVSKKDITVAEASEIVTKLSPKVAASEITKTLNKSIAGMQKSEIGGLAPQFTAPTPEGTMLSLQETLGKYTIIDFWASWCRPCRVENPNVVRVYNKYHDKGLNIISVSLDKAGQKDRWIKAIADDNMDWYHVSNLQSWKDPIAAQYGVRSIPATFLLDEEGKIIAKNLRGPALEAKIASLLGE
ncbi:TlpA disulfide reductase family protein [Ulvibacter litoralis]|uniref:Peroxiredoxin n=1 Tax=Ulvibacter litoralis TaxID=227084 RepID=A0A1G7HLJ5_9FLAO|nr:TlpA disulfide reductase family protein [Ulvibacter litoralis]GHC58292.1 thiol:disulfide interchange protein [Ulvibacter litoralis]SDF01305.1 Peroxiredoxin [Ulvibacter litoralis]